MHETRCMSFPYQTIAGVIPDLQFRHERASREAFEATSAFSAYLRSQLAYWAPVQENSLHLLPTAESRQLRAGPIAKRPWL